MNFQELETYLQQLAASHKDLLDGFEGRKSFMRIFSNDELNSIPQKPNPFIVIVENITARPIGEQDANLFSNNWTISFLGKAAVISGDPTMARDNVIQKCWSIMMQFVARMKKDWEDDQCGPLQGLSFKMNYRIIEDMQLENHFGWELQFSQTITAPDYDPAQWQ